ncbi:MAG: hypothetical protein JSV36_03125 [Anaerolineae bacterium]|nr:MAG: hypothetical protein JSV36_03125 [Anaerolineae bacterium]
MKERAVFEAHSSCVLGLLFTRDSRTLISAGMDNVVRLWSVSDWGLVSTFEGHANSTKAVNGMAFSPDGRWLAVGAADRKIRVWEQG